MLTDIGEFIVGAHLQLIEECDFVDYNVRPPGGGLKGLSELDVRRNLLLLHVQGLLFRSLFSHDA